MKCYFVEIVAEGMLTIINLYDVSVVDEVSDDDNEDYQIDVYLKNGKEVSLYFNDQASLVKGLNIIKDGLSNLNFRLEG